MSTIAIGQPSATERTITLGAFWPEIDPAAARAAQRIDGTVTTERWRDALMDAAATVMGQLSSWRVTQTAAGYTTLDAVPADQIDDESIHVQRFLRAVYCLAAASVTERYRGFDATDSGNRLADELETPIDDLRRDAHWAINDILGRSRSTVELI
ncbi:head completion/stabilization protein [Denitromonas iodatirespirans]|uniref:Head completion/stabilization protein n=2 Tax=Rhodocyclales TaxID=206389 RepID=A0A944D898_DENI1|nr:head completion/stabilization protein [Denitromonas iodatirespirans]MBT0961655.1 head completion/stabilization protein [Denitromonas iodatirespirans]